MRQYHVAGERMFVDYAGATLAVIDAANGAVRQAQLFVAVLGASNYTFAEATWTQSLPDWIGSHCQALAWFGGVPAQIVSDNLKSGVTKACFYEPAINRTYADMPAHYDTAVVPARPYKPRDKAKVEVAVQVADLDRLLGDPRPDLLAQEPVGHRIVVAVDLDMVVEPDRALLPLRVDVRGAGQRLQRRPLEVLEQLPVAGAEMAGDAVVEPIDQLADCRGRIAPSAERGEGTDGDRGSRASCTRIEGAGRRDASGGRGGVMY
jgi:hypothetical protein